MKNPVEWNDRFNIGIESIDKAHKRLFSIVCRLIELNEDEEKGHWACMEAVKYFKNYTRKHFEEEEAYMKSIRYEGYAVHKRLHDDLRDKKLPAMEEELEESDYSAEAVRHFIGNSIGWLTGHIMIEDYAIGGRVSRKWVYDPKDEQLKVLEKALSQVIYEVFRADAKVVSERYGGEEFGNMLCYRLNYKSPKGNRMQVVFSLEEQLILHAVSGLTGTQFKKIDKTVLSVVSQMLQLFMKRMSIYFKSLSAYQIEKENFLTYEQMVRLFDKEYPPYSMLMDTGSGYLAFCLKK